MRQKRKTWTSRACGCGKEVMTRFQLDAAYCGDSRCWDAVFRSLGYVPSKETRAWRKKHRPELDRARRSRAKARA